MKRLGMVLVFVIALAIGATDALAADALVYDGGGSQANIQGAMNELGIAFDLRTPANPVTAGDLDTHDVLVIGWNYGGDMSGVPAAVLASGITGNVVITGHDADVHTVHGYDYGSGGDAVDAAATQFLRQAIAYARLCLGTGLVALGDYDGGFAYLPGIWGLTGVGGLLEETINSFTAAGDASGVYSGLTPAQMSDWGQSYHAKFTATGIFQAFELGKADGSEIVTIGGPAGAPSATETTTWGSLKSLYR